VVARDIERSRSRRGKQRERVLLLLLLLGWGLPFSASVFAFSSAPVLSPASLLLLPSLFSIQGMRRRDRRNRQFYVWLATRNAPG